jgi:FkbM family methyltransferase
MDERRNAGLVAGLRRVLEGDPLTLVDVGAAGGLEPRWQAIAPLVNYVGFEPDERSRVSMESRPSGCAGYRLFPYAIWDRDGELEFNLCREPQVSSHYLPNHAFLSRFPNSRRFDVLRRVTLPCRRLDSLDITLADFIKLDVQGGELAVLRGAPLLLSRCMGVEAEVEFLPLYVGQPLFGDIGAVLSGHGLEFLDFTTLRRWERTAHGDYGQCVFGNALFLKSPETIVAELGPGAADIARALRYAAICALYRRLDLVERLRDLLRERAIDNVVLRRIAGVIEPMRREQGRLSRLLRGLHRGARTFGQNYVPHLFY